MPIYEFISILDFYSRTSYEVRPGSSIQNTWLLPFLLTHLLRGATCIAWGCGIAWIIFLLTHLLRGATKRELRLTYHFADFYSRTSYEVRRCRIIRIMSKIEFLLTHLLRGATRLTVETESQAKISTHAPLTRCDYIAMALLIN